MHRIDHVCIASRNLYEGAERLRDETGLDSYDSGWFPGMGIGQRIVPLGGHTYIEIMSVIDRDMALGHFYGKWYEATLADAGREDQFMGWQVAVDTDEELEAIATRIGLPVADQGDHDGDIELAWDRRLPSGHRHRNRVVPNDREHRWPRGLPMFMLWPDEAVDHPDTIPEAKTVKHRVQPTGITWVEVGDEAATREWLGPEGEGLDIRYVDRPAGLYAFGIGTADGEIVIRRDPVPLHLRSQYAP